MRELAAERPRWGWRRLKVLFKREGIAIGYDRFLRIYRANSLQVRPRRKRKVNYVRGNVVPAVTRPNERWSIDFMHDRLANGRKIRTLNIVDDFTRECLALRIAYSLGSTDVIREFEDIAFERGFPETIRFDNGPEFTSLAMLRWSAERRVRPHFIDPGKPTQNANIESLNGKIRDELLNLHSFTTIFEARRAAEAWRNDYNDVRPHSSSRPANTKGVCRSIQNQPHLTIICGLKLPHTSAFSVLRRRQQLGARPVCAAARIANANL